MKEPKGHHPYDGEFGDDTGACVADSEEWPCKTWRRWIKSKDYRIAELEALTKRLEGESARHGERLREIEKTVRDDSNILRNGIYRAMTDVGAHGRMGSLALDWQQDELDVSEFMSPRTRVPLPAELTVIYKDIGGRTWTNGEITEQNYPHGG